MSIIPIADKEAWDRFEFLANWYGDKFDETPNVCRQTNILLTFGGTKGGTNYNY